MKDKVLKHIYFIIPVIILIIIQLPNLGLPYFWDEAWSYFPAIKKMAEIGPSLLPGVLPLDYCKGHPQFFFFITSLWMKVFPDSILLMRILPFMISMALLAVIYFGLIKLANQQTAFIATLLVSVQSLFLAQAIFLLPEMLMTLLFILSFFFFLQKRFFAYAITSSLMVLTKETAIIFSLLFGLYYLLSLIVASNREKYKHSDLIALIFPGIVYGIFLILHYFKFGVFFYTTHLEYVKFDWNTLFSKFKEATNSVLNDYGRLYISIATVISAIVYFYQRPAKSRFLALGILSFVVFMVFSIFNFYTKRYGLVSMITFIVLFSYIFGQLNLKNYYKLGITFTLSLICLYFSLTKKHNADSDLGYIETIKVHQQLVEFCEQKNLYAEPFAVTFNMIFCLRDKNLGYITGNNEFKNIMDWKHYTEAKYYIHESTMGNPEGFEFVKENFKLIDSYANKHAWGEIYENIHYQDSALMKQAISAAERQKKIEGFINAIKSTPEWLESVKKKAIEKNISLDSMILLDAIYMVDVAKK